MRTTASGHNPHPDPSAPEAALAVLADSPVALDPMALVGALRHERAHTHLLAWMLDGAAAGPGQQHDFGPALVGALLALGLDRCTLWPGSLGRVAACATVVPGSLRVLRETPVGDGRTTRARAPDLVCRFAGRDGSAWVMVIEVKVDADEGLGQVSDYLAFLDREAPAAKHLLLFVTPDGRPAQSGADDAHRVAAVGWSELAEALVAALDAAPCPPEARDAFVFLRLVAEGWRCHLGGSAAVRRAVERVHRAGLAGSPEVSARAAWHLAHVRRDAHGLTYPFAAQVADAWNLGGSPISLVAAAPNARCDDRAVWHLGPLTDTLSVALLATEGRAFQRHRQQLWVGFFAGAAEPREALEAREQRDWLAGLSPRVLGLLEGATAWAPGGRRDGWWVVGAPVALAAVYDRARPLAVLDQIAGLLSVFEPVLGSLAATPEMRLYSCDLDPRCFSVRDARDRQSLWAALGPDAVTVGLAVPEARGALHQVGFFGRLGPALGATLGGRESFAYTYLGVSGLRPPERLSVVMVMTQGWHSDDEALADEIAALVGAGAVLWVLDRGGEVGTAAAQLPAVLRALVGGAAGLAAAVTRARESGQVVALGGTPHRAVSLGAASPWSALVEAPEVCEAWWRAMLGAKLS
ncbi:MAG: PD-(D/E)XK nuclease family protein [Myxococcales bacterium]|nr:PD-(D/E)XK nuclease family protein [Myxococcales bacterium]